MISLETNSAEETRLIGRTLGSSMRIGDLVLLYGELGTGKTVLSKGVAEGLNCETFARSPTFVIVNEYKGDIPLSHCDLYRLTGGLEVEELALEERLERGALIVEWAERGEAILPRDALTVRIDFGDTTCKRDIVMIAGGVSSDRLAGEFDRMHRAIARLE